MASTSNCRAISTALAAAFGASVGLYAGVYAVAPSGSVDELAPDTATYDRAAPADETAIKAAAAQAGATSQLTCYDYKGTTRCTDVQGGGTADFEVPIEASSLIIVDGRVYTKPAVDTAEKVDDGS
jgi:hypothetical protein